jgi:hypothetical protein
MHLPFDNPVHGKYHVCMDGGNKKKTDVKQPDNMVHYKSKKELFSTVHACIMLRELPELTPEELKQISDKERSANLDAES